MTTVRWLPPNGGGAETPGRLAVNLNQHGRGIDRSAVERSGLAELDVARAPQLPGYVAVSATVLDGVYLNEAGRAFYKPLRERPPRAVIGYSIFVYWVDRPWW